MSDCSKMRVTYSSRGNPTYEIEIWHDGLGKHKELRARNASELEARANEMMAKWDLAWMQESKLKQAEIRSREAKRMNDDLMAILDQTIAIDDAIDWESLKDKSPFAEPHPEKPEYPKKGFLALILKSARAKHEAKIADIESEHDDAVKEWGEEKAAYEQAQQERNDEIELMKQQYEEKIPETILDYCKLVLTRSSYPSIFPKAFEIEYREDSQILIINYQLPALEDIPTLTDVRYVKTRDEFTEKHLPRSKLNSLYDEILYQVAIRTLHELFEADRIDAIDAIGFNGYVETNDRASGAEITPCVLSLQARKEEFNSIALDKVEPKACFKMLKGIAASKLHSMTPIAPVIQMDKKDSRFVAPYGVADDLSEVDNIAAMDWQDFEHLIRELFEKEFADSGAEVKVTQASRDKGVDAVVFDPDPIRGGKTVIQAKRYTNTVGVSAVRDLYGTVLNEGAGKGILVTTSDYGPDAYDFAKDKPLVLINGNNLLHMLEKHGHEAMIDLKAARELLADH